MLPISNPFINEDWITNAARFSYDALDTQRLLSPMLKIFIEGKISYIKTSWLYIFSYLKSKFECLDFKNLNNILDVSFMDIESLIAWKDFINGLGIPINSKVYGESIIDIRANFLLSSIINSLDKIKNVLCIGVELLPIIKYRLRKSNVLYLGNSKHKKTIGHYYLLSKIAYGMHEICKSMLKTDFLLLFGLENLKMFSIFKMIENKTGSKVSLLQEKAGFTGALDIGIPYTMTLNLEEKACSYIVHADQVNINKGFTIFQGYFGSKVNWDVILPSTNFVEKKGIYSNIEGLFSETKKVLTASINTRSDWEIFTALNLYLSSNKAILIWKDMKVKTYGKMKIVRRRVKQIMPLFSFNKFFNLKVNINGTNKIKKNKNIINNNVFNYYNTNAVLKNSKIMNLCALESYKLHYTYA